MLGLENAVRQLRHLVCKKVSLTTLSSIKNPVLVLFYWVVYVDDIVIAGSDSKGILSIKSFLHSQFHRKKFLLYYLLS